MFRGSDRQQIEKIGRGRMRDCRPAPRQHQWLFFELTRLWIQYQYTDKAEGVRRGNPFDRDFLRVHQFWKRF